ncbi:hypothetical protein [Longispora albida]|uniref:hypothetical protein n=1 Tax=Longispora albida TaxID=203523 RepID=UPI00037FDD97|nr:hypothetical protein [Longispora albida]
MTVAAPATGRRRILLGFTDQAVFGLASAGNALLATAVLDPDRAGAVLISITTVYFVMGISRAFVGEVVLAHVSRYDGAERRQREEDALASTLTLSVAGAVICLGLWLFGPSEWFGDLIWAIPFLPALMTHDTGRHTYLAAREQAGALTVDLTWVLTQAAAVTAFLLAGWREGGTLLVAWGLGATAGSLLFLFRSRLNPLRGHIRNWFAETRHLSGWFTGSAVIGQSQTMLIAVIVAEFLTEAAYAGLRLAQLVVLQPLQNFITAMNALMVPRFSRFASAGDLPALRRLTFRVAAFGLVVGLAAIAVVVAVTGPVLGWYKNGDYAFVEPIALPVAIQAAIYLMQIPFTAALRGMQQGKFLFMQYAVFTATSLTGVVLGARDGSLTGAAWGLTTGAAVGFIAMIILYWFAAHGPRRPEPQR